MKKYFYLLCLAFIPAALFAQQNSSVRQQNILTPFKPWLLRGNKNTDTAMNFLGTIDAKPLLFKVNSYRAGYIDYDSTAANTAFGYQALQFNTSIQNAAFGYRAMAANIGGELDVAVGYYALAQNTYGLGNTAVGASTLANNTSGSVNIAVGADAMLSNTYGSNNVGIGGNALQHNQTGGSNVAIGNLALVSNDAYYNTSIGESSMYSNTSGQANVAMGVFPLFINTTGNYNTALGYASLFTNTTGSNNTAVGNSALFSNTTGNNNTAIGYNANEYGNINNATAIGYNAFADSGNKVRLGNDNVMSIGGVVGFTNYAADNIKENIKENVPGLEFIKALRPVTYNLNIPDEFFAAKTNDYLAEKTGRHLLTAGKISDNTSKEINDIRFTGLIAKEVNSAAKKLNYNFSGVDKNGITWGIRYEEFVVPLIKAVQELNEKHDNDSSRIDSLKNELYLLNKKLERLENLISRNCPVAQSNLQNDNASSIILPDNATSKLQQNVPNPYTGSTTISYYISSKTNNASINFYNASGKLLKSVAVSSGKGSTTFNSSQLAAGIYKYTLVVDNIIVDSKTMVQSR